MVRARGKVRAGPVDGAAATVGALTDGVAGVDSPAPDVSGVIDTGADDWPVDVFSIPAASACGVPGAGGVFQLREDELAPRVGAGLNRTP